MVPAHGPPRPASRPHRRALTDAECLRQRFTDALAGEPDELVRTLAAAPDETLFSGNEFAIGDFVLRLVPRSFRWPPPNAKNVTTGTPVLAPLAPARLQVAAEAPHVTLLATIRASVVLTLRSPLRQVQPARRHPRPGGRPAYPWGDRGGRPGRCVGPLRRGESQHLAETGGLRKGESTVWVDSRTGGDELLPSTEAQISDADSDALAYDPLSVMLVLLPGRTGIGSQMVNKRFHAVEMLDVIGARYNSTA